MSEFGSQRAYARHRRALGLAGGTSRAVQVALRAGRITALSDGRIDFERADRDWAANTIRPRLRSGATPRSGAEPPPGSYAPSVSYVEAQRQLVLARKRLADLEWERRSGKLLDASEVRHAAFNEARHARDRVLAIPDRMASILAAETDSATVHRLLTAELRQACEHMTDAPRN